MTQVGQVLKSSAFDLLHSRVTIVYGLFFFLLSWGILYFSDDAPQTLASLTNVAVLVIPLVGVVFGIVHVYNSREFIELLLAQPIERKSVFVGHYLGLALPLVAVFIVGTLLPFVLYRAIGRIDWDPAIMVYVAGGGFLTLISSGLAFLIATHFEDRTKGLGVGVFLWLVFSFIYDGLILFVTIAFRDYPLERPLIALSLLNPIDIARISVLLKLDVAALMGYTGAVFEKFFETVTGLLVLFISLSLWTMIPVGFGLKAFKRKDF